jgi:hypothetical protein
MLGRRPQQGGDDNYCVPRINRSFPGSSLLEWAVRIQRSRLRVGPFFNNMIWGAEP